MYVVYSPVQMPGATWDVLTIQPYGETFAALMIQLQGAIIAASAIAAGLGFVIYKSKKT